MNFLPKLRRFLFLLLLYEIMAEVGSRKIEKKVKKSSKTKSKTRGHKAKGKKQFFPMPMGQVGQYPVSPQPMPQYKPDSKQEMKISKGLPRAYDCSRSKHGCCWDGRTPAFGPAGKGCPQCRDVYKDFCKRTKKLCDCPMVADYCRITCKLCRTGKKRSKTCQSSTYNCCWDGKTSAKGPNGEGCPKIKDDPIAKCSKFESECLRNPYYMWTKCRNTCLKNLPPIEPFLQGLGPVSDLGIPPSACGQPFPGMPPGQSAPGTLYPYPSMPHGLNGSPMRKKTSRKNIKLLEKKHRGSDYKS